MTQLRLPGAAFGFADALAAHLQSAYVNVNTAFVHHELELPRSWSISRNSMVSWWFVRSLSGGDYLN